MVPVFPGFVPVSAPFLPVLSSFDQFCPLPSPQRIPRVGEIPDRKERKVRNERKVRKRAEMTVLTWFYLGLGFSLSVIFARFCHF